MSKKVEGGLQTQGYFKKSYDDKHLITVVTVVFNGKTHLEETILSIIAQSYSNIEYIVIDGGSIDGTLEIIDKYKNKIDYWVSESDKGIYDAMNKGVEAATGDWVIFINSSDTLNRNSCNLISDYLASCSRKCDAIAFGYSIIDNRGKLKSANYTPSLDKKWKMPSSHNSIIYRLNILKKNKFDLNYKCASDFHQISKISNAGEICKSDSILTNSRNDGFIAQNKRKSFSEYFWICWKCNNKVYALYWFLRLILEYPLTGIKRVAKVVRKSEEV